MQRQQVKNIFYGCFSCLSLCSKISRCIDVAVKEVIEEYDMGCFKVYALRYIKVTLQSREVENFWPLFFGHVLITSIWLHYQKIRKFYPRKLNLQVVSNCR